MQVQISDTQRKRVEKIERLRRYFKEDSPLSYQWSTSDEALDFTAMSDAEVADYLKKAN